MANDDSQKKLAGIKQQVSKKSYRKFARQKSTDENKLVLKNSQIVMALATAEIATSTQNISMQTENIGYQTKRNANFTLIVAVATIANIFAAQINGSIVWAGEGIVYIFRVVFIATCFLLGIH